MFNRTFLKAFKPSTILSDFRSLNVRQRCFLSFMIVTMIALSLSWGETIVGLIVGITGVVCVFLVNMRKLSNYFWGTINVTLYAYVAYKASYYGDTMLNAFFYLPLQFIGAYYWSQSMQGDEVISKKLSYKTKFIMVFFIAISILLYTQFLKWLNGNLVYVDASTTVLSIFAMFLMVNGYREQWICWIVINVLSIFMWTVNYQETNEGIGVLVMWCLFLTNSLYGLYTWSKNIQ